MAASPTQLNVYPPRDLRDAIKALADEERRSLSQMFVILAEEGIKARKERANG